jgi:hypothetical protein
MPRSRTRAYIRAAKRAAGLTPHDPERTAGRVGHVQRKIWKNFAARHDSGVLVRREVGVTREARKAAITAAINRWIKVCIAQERAEQN